MRSLLCMAYDLCDCLLNQCRTKPCHRMLVATPFIQTLKIKSPTYLTETGIQAFEKRLLADQHLSESGAGGARGVFSCPTKESKWKKSHE